MTSPLPPITIIGAGLSGLTLGLALKHNGIKAVIYDRAVSRPRYNYGISLQSSAYRPLLSMLHMDETTFREKLAVNAHQGGNGSLSTTNISHQLGAFRCHRGQLEDLLSNGLPIYWGKMLTDIKLKSRAEGLIGLFDDGSCVETTCLIGCDGPHSMTRQSLSPTMKIEVLPYVVFNGKQRIPIKEYMELIH